jgi:hypothetical protein
MILVSRSCSAAVRLSSCELVNLTKSRHRLAASGSICGSMSFMSRLASGSTLLPNVAVMASVSAM